MGLLGKSPKVTLEADDVKKNYDSRIADFLQYVGEPISMFSRDEPLDALFKWGRAVQSKFRKRTEELNAKSTEYNQQLQARQYFESKSNQLEDSKADLEMKLKKAQRELESAKYHHRHEIDRLKGEHSEAVDTLQVQMQNERNESEVRFESLKMSHADDMERMQVNHKEESNTLIGQLLVNQEENREWPDDVLKRKFDELHRLVDMTASTDNEELVLPEGCSLSTDMDPTGIVKRLGVARGHLLLKSVIWDQLRQRFFSVPFGLGAFGPDVAPAKLLASFNDWRRWYQSKHEGPTTISDLTIFETDPIANRWRTTTFQGISVRLSGKDGDSSSSIATMWNENKVAARDQIASYLSSIAALSHKTLGAAAQQELSKAVDQAAEIALHFGIHSSKLVLLNPNQPVRMDPAPGLLKFGKDDGDGPKRYVIVNCRGYIEK